MRLEIDSEIRKRIVSPSMFAGWTGMGNVGLEAVHYMRSVMEAREFAHIDMSDELMPASVSVRNGLVLHEELPTTRFYHSENPSIIFMEGPAQLSGRSALSLMRGVIDLAREMKVSTIYTAASFAMPTGCEHEVVVFAAANDPVLRDRLNVMGAKPLDEGQVSGMNGVLLEFTEDSEIPAACLMATMPQYAIRLPNPKSSRAIIRLLERILGCRVEMARLDEEVEKMTEVMLGIEKRILEVASVISGDDAGMADQEASEPRREPKTPERAMQKIEQLFQEVAREKSKDKATRLKKELDRWNLYDLYEDRFLGLFKGGEDEEE